MALPYSPRTTFDVTVDLNANDVRTYDGSAYTGKHVRVIPKTGVDAAKGLLFNGCASVTLVGGHFKPSVLGSYADGTLGPGSLTFNAVGAVYLEGVVIDNADIFDNGGDALFCTAKTALTTITLQNCHFTNVRGLESTATAHGDVFQTGSANMGLTGPVRLYNCTFGGNYQGLFLDPQTGGGLTALTLNRVNLYRTSQVTPIPRLLYLFSSGAAYDTAGYPASFTDVWLDGGAGQGIADTIWPSNVPGSVNFDVKYQAQTGTDSLGTYANYPGLTDGGKAVSGKIYQGKPAGGDYAPIAKIGLNYVQGTDLGATSGVTTPWAGVPDGNLLLPQNWNKSGTGTIAITGATGQVAITSTGSRTAVSQPVPTEIGSRYRLTYHIDTTQSIASPVGTADGLDNIVAEFLRSPAPGDQAFEFTATAPTTYVGLSRTTAGNPTASSVIFEKVPAGATKARRLDGASQWFTLAVASAGLRAANYNWFIGGWMRWTYVPTVAAYILDFGDPAGTGGGARNRLAYDPANSKLFCSSSSPDGTSYRECGYVATFQRDVWYHIGMLCPAGGDIQLFVNGVSVGTRTGSITPLSDTVGKVLTLGARTGSAVTNGNPARYADWVWCSNTNPAAAQIAALAAGKRPNEITGFNPTYWWAFDQTSTTEPSLKSAATLTATGAPTTVAGPVVAVVAPPATASSRVLDLIII